MIRIKDGVSIKGIQPEMLLGKDIVEQVYTEFNLDTVITSGTEGFDGDGVHKLYSLHYIGLALDFRKRIVPEAYRAIFLETLQDRLGKEFDVVDCGTCYHCEFDSK